jgi:hypothetical protein
MSNTKAIHLKNLKKFLLERGGEPLWEKVLAVLTPADRDVAAKPAIASEWLDYHLWWRLLQAAERVLGNGDGAVIRTIGAYDARETLNGIYRVFISFLVPGFVISRCWMLWQRYYDTGKMVAVKSEPKHGELELRDFPDLPAGHEEELIGWMGEALRITGVKNVTVEHPECRARGDAVCRFVLRWD